MEKLSSISHECTDMNMIPKLTTELITNILLRLPPKPLARSKCVSKSFLSLISTRSFILSHINRSLSTFSNLHITRLGRSTLASLHLSTLDSTPPQTLHLPFTTRALDSDFIGSCHGLLCISDHPNFLALFSPTTRTHRVIPVRVPRTEGESHWVDFGLGYDPSSDDYKVVRVDQLNGPTAGLTDREVRVYCMKDNKWRKLNVGLPHFLARPKAHGVYLHNSVHWMCTTNPPNVYDVLTNMRYRGQSDKTVYKYVILGFDMSSEIFNKIEMPVSHSWIKKSIFPQPTIAVLGEKLVVQIEYGETDNRKMDLWVMNEYGVKDSWVKLLTLSFKKLGKLGGVSKIDRGWIKTGRVKPLVVAQSGDGSLEVLFERNGSEQVIYIWYNVVNGVARKVKVLGDLPPLFEWRGGHCCDYWSVVFGETLVSLDNSGLQYAEKPVNPVDNAEDFQSTSSLGLFRRLSQPEMERSSGSNEATAPLVGVGYGERLL